MSNLDILIEELLLEEEDELEDQLDDVEGDSKKSDSDESEGDEKESSEEDKESEDSEKDEEKPEDEEESKEDENSEEDKEEEPEEDKESEESGENPPEDNSGDAPPPPSDDNPEEPEEEETGIEKEQLLIYFDHFSELVEITKNFLEKINDLKEISNSKDEINLLNIVEKKLTKQKIDLDYLLTKKISSIDEKNLKQLLVIFKTKIETLVDIIKSTFKENNSINK